MSHRKWEQMKQNDLKTMLPKEAAPKALYACQWANCFILEAWGDIYIYI